MSTYELAKQTEPSGFLKTGIFRSFLASCFGTHLAYLEVGVLIREGGTYI